MLRKQHRVLSLCLALLFLLTACASEDEAVVVRYDLRGSVTTLDPQLMEPGEAQVVPVNTFEPLLRFRDGTICAGAADRWEISEDGTDYTS